MCKFGCVTHVGHIVQGELLQSWRLCQASNQPRCIPLYEVSESEDFIVYVAEADCKVCCTDPALAMHSGPCICHMAYRRETKCTRAC